MKFMKSIQAAAIATISAGLLSACVAAPSGSDSGAVITVPAPIIIGQQPDIIVIDKTKKDDEKENKSVHVCKMSAFTHTYTAEDTNRGKAKLSVKKQCLANFHDMHCSDEKISCTEYK